MQKNEPGQGVFDHALSYLSDSGWIRARNGSMLWRRPPAVVWFSFTDALMRQFKDDEVSLNVRDKN